MLAPHREEGGRRPRRRVAAGHAAGPNDRRLARRRWKPGSPIRKERSAATKPTTSSSRSDTPAPTAPPDELWRRSKPNGDWAIHACTDRGSPSPDCGCSTTSPTAPLSPAARLCCWWRGWRGAATASWWRLRDRTAPSVFAGLDRIFRIVGGAPTYLLTDNEKTVTTGHIAGVPVRNRAAVTFGRYYGISVLTCEPADPASKGGVENAVKLAKADIVPTETNLLPQYATFADVEAACAGFTAEINARVHRSTGRRPVEMLTQERPALHAMPDLPHTAALGVTRRVPDNTPMVTFEHCQYSLPATLLGQTVWIRHHDGTDEVVICALDDGGPVEVARHRRAAPGSPAIDDDHFPEHRDKVPGDYRVRARTACEQTFLALGPGAAVWLKEAAAVGTERILQKMAHAVELSALAGRADVDWALGHAAVHGRFATGDLDSILAAKGMDPTRRGADEDTSLAQGTSGWNLFGRTVIDAPEAGIA